MAPPLLHRVPNSGEANRMTIKRAATEDPLPAKRARGPDPVAWLASLALHASALVLLATATIFTPMIAQPLLLSSPLPEPEEPTDVAFRVDDAMTADVGALSDGGAGDAAAAAPVEAALSEIDLAIEPMIDLGAIAALDAPEPVLTSPDPNNEHLVRGVGAVGVSGSGGAVDRLTKVILDSLDQRPTLVVWLFDSSTSLRDQREEIVGRFDKVYGQLGVIKERGAQQFSTKGPSDESDDAPLLTAIVSFAASAQFVTPKPTDDVAKLKQAVRSIDEDASGNENVFSAVLQTLERYRRYRLAQPRRNVLLVVVTDEAGDDEGMIDKAVSACGKLQTPVYVIGAPAPFGRRDAYVRYVDPDPKFDQTPQYLPVRQGPESLHPEALQLGAPGSGDFAGPTLDSGFGPFGLTRLADQSGGFFLAVHPFRVASGAALSSRRQSMTARIDYFFDERLMSRYRPDFLPTDEYLRRANENAARAALLRASALSWTATLVDPRRDFPKLDDAQFAQDLTGAQRAAAVVEPQLTTLVTVLRQGERDRPKLDEARWEAGYDLALGRALAAKVRAVGYNAMLARAKAGLTFAKQSDTWVLEPTDAIATGSEAAAEAARAVALLEAVRSQHAGTPWAYLADRELKSPLGWRWREEFRNLAEIQRRMQQVANPPQPPRPQPPAPPRRPPPKL
ncbi:MAG: vWA domain-containing protein [Lacipirellulaceae bacterium]